MATTHETQIQDWRWNPPEECIDPSQLYLPAAFDGELWASVDDDDFNALIRDFDPNATPIASPLPTADITSDQHVVKEPLLLTPESGGFAASQESRHSAPPETNICQTTECESPISGLISTAQRFKGLLEFTYSGSEIRHTLDLALLENLLSHTNDCINALETSGQQNAEASRCAKKRARSLTPSNEANDSERSWTGAESALDKYSTAIEQRLLSCRNSTLLITSLSKRERRLLRAQAHMKRLNHLSFGLGTSRCLLISRHGILDQKRATRTGCAFVDSNNRHWIDLTIIEPVICHESCADSPKYHLCNDTPHLGCDPIIFRDLGALVRREGPIVPVNGNEAQLATPHSHETARICARLHNQPKSRVCTSDTADSSQVIKICFPLVVMTDPPQSVHGKRERADDDSTGHETAASFTESSVNVSSDSNRSTRKRQKRQPRIERGYGCQDCGKRFDTAGEMTKHAVIHQPESQRPYACRPECGKRFINRKDLTRHLKTPHSRSRSVSLASSSSELDFQLQPGSKNPSVGFNNTMSYMKDPTSETIVDAPTTPFLLEITQGAEACDSFQSVSDSEVNWGIWACLFYPQVLHSALALEQHVRATHRGTVFECMQCGETYTTEDSLTRHETAQHGAELHCRHANCAYRTKRKDDLRRHEERMHGYMTQPPADACDVPGVVNERGLEKATETFPDSVEADPQ